MNTTPFPHGRRRAGFTLVEILVVIGIIVLLAGILVPMVTRAMRTAKQTRIAADMQAIATALEAFKADQGDYPRVGAADIGFALLGKNLLGPLGDGLIPPFPPGSPDPDDPPAYNAAKTYGPGDVVQSGGAGGVHYLCISPSTTVGPPAPQWLKCDPAATATPSINLTDGVDGPGIRLRDGGKKWGPYLQDGKFKVRGVAILDINDNPILYFPARTGAVNVSVAASYLPAVLTTAPPATATNETTKYDVFDNWSQFIHASDAGNVQRPQWRVHAMLGDFSCDGAINAANASPSETAVDRPYLLWSAGTDGLFGPETITDGTGSGPASNYEANRKAAGECDDVTNFR